MSLTQRPPNFLLQALPATEFDALQPHLKTVEMVRETVLVEAGSTPAQIHLPHSGAISITVGLAEGQQVEALPLTQEFLVRTIGVQRNAVSIVARSLQRAGTTRYSRARIAIANVEAPGQTSCECYQAVKAAHDRLLRMSPRYPEQDTPNMTPRKRISREDS